MSLRDWLLQQADAERARQNSQALVETFPGTSAGRALPSSPLDQSVGQGIPAVNILRAPGSGELIALTGTATIAGAGSGLVTQMDTIQAQAGLPAVENPGDTVTLRKASWLAEVDIRWTDGYRGGGTVEVTLGGTAIGSSWDNDGQPWGRFVDTVAFPVEAQSAFDVKVTPDDGQAHTAEATVRVTLIEKLRTVAPTTATPATAGTTWRRTKTDSLPASWSASFGTPAGTVEGDLLVAAILLNTWNSGVTITGASGWTQLGYYTSGNTAVMLLWKAASATDETNGGTGTLHYTATGTIATPRLDSLDDVEMLTCAVSTSGRPTGSGVQTVSGTVPNNTAASTAAASGGDWTMVLTGMSTTSNTSSRFGYFSGHDWTAVSHWTESGAPGPAVGVGTAAAGASASYTVRNSNTGNNTAHLLAVVPMSGGGGGG